MKPSKALDEKAIFRNAIVIDDPAEQDEYLVQACAGNVSLLQRLRDLIHADNQSNAFLSSPVHRMGSKPEKEVKHPFSDSNEFVVIKRIGRGATSEVFLVRTTGRYQRLAACKLLKEGLLGTRMSDQLLREGEFLARMEHPAIPTFFRSGKTDSGRPFLLLERVSGQPITEFCRDHQLDLHSRIRLFIKVCKGVEHAHVKGIIHRDLKPTNVLTEDVDGTPMPKIIDFGISQSKISNTSQSSAEADWHEMTGSIAYMSPEHLIKSREGIDTRSDIYSLGVLLYEIVTGSHPYYQQLCEADNMDEISEFISSHQCSPPSIFRKVSRSRIYRCERIGEDLDSIICKMMEKNISNRYGTISQAANDLQSYLECKPISTCSRPVRTGVRRWFQRNRYAVNLALAVTIVMILFFSYRQYSQDLLISRENELTQQIQQIQMEWGNRQAASMQRDRARQETVPRLELLLKENRVAEAFHQATKFTELLSDDHQFQKLWEDISTTITCSYLPSGTAFHLRIEENGSQEWVFLGKTPFVHLEVPKGRAHLKLAHPDYQPREINLRLPEEFSIIQTELLEPLSAAVPGMVLVPVEKNLFDPVDSEGEVRTDFWIDQYEVTNAQFNDFVSSGGYLNESYWDGIPMEKEGKAMSLEQARLLFTDKTGELGPSTWVNGHYPEGAAQLPVSGVSWYEAYAYANYCGKDLPTQAHWKRASSSSYPQDLAEWSNFGLELLPVTQNSHIGYYHTYNLFGNVREWCMNPCDADQRAMLGASVGDAGYMFYMPRVESPWDRMPANGFRCMLAKDQSEYEALAKNVIALPKRDVSSLKREPIDALKHWYGYDKTVPLQPMVIRDSNASLEGDHAYRYKIVEINAVYDDERFQVHFFEPEKQKDVPTLVYLPGIGRYNVQRDFRITGSRDMDMILVHRLALLGYRVIYPIYNGTYERWNGSSLSIDFREKPAEAQSNWIRGVQDLFRVVDYLCQAEDLNQDKLICVGLSNGAARAITAMSIDDRFKAGILISAGLTDWHQDRPVLNHYHFAPHVGQPLLMITGLQDSLYRYENSQVPLFQDLGSSEKKHVALPGGHLPDVNEIVEAIHAWIPQQFPNAD